MDQYLGGLVSEWPEAALLRVRGAGSRRSASAGAWRHPPGRCPA